jgi:phosphoglycolate phosphatase-like HAD superfamily hydrolase
MNPLAAVVFDFDGTLVRLVGQPGEMDQLRSEVGKLLLKVGISCELRPFYIQFDQALAKLSERDDRLAARLRRQSAEIIDVYEQKWIRRSEPCIGAKQAWRFAAERWKVAVVSNNTQACVRRGITEHGLCSAAEDYLLVAFEDVARHKPEPDAFCRLAEMLGLHARDWALYVGDHVTDLEACRRFNVLGGPRLLPVAVRGGKCRWEDLARHPEFREELVLDDLSRLPELLLFNRPPAC